MAVGGITLNKKVFGPGVAGVDHIRHTHDLARNAFSRGQPKHGAEFADELERLCLLHDPSTIAAVIVEPVEVGRRTRAAAGLPGTPARNLQSPRNPAHLRRSDHRLRSPREPCPQHFGVMPDLFTVAKGMTNATVPMGAVFAKQDIFDVFMQGPEGIEIFHGYTYSATRSPARRASRRSIRTKRKGCSPGLPNSRRTGSRRSTRSRTRRTSSTSVTAASWARSSSSRAPPARQACLRGLREGVRGGSADPRCRGHHRAVAAAHRRTRAYRPHRRMRRQHAAHHQLTR